MIRIKYCSIEVKFQVEDGGVGTKTNSLQLQCRIETYCTKTIENPATGQQLERLEADKNISKATTTENVWSRQQGNSVGAALELWSTQVRRSEDKKCTC